uniref:Uncharacterized protein n=1 Tax=Corethron hystrix TaxID=216773 RepID=A0A7S1FLP2_9STRA
MCGNIAEEQGNRDALSEYRVPHKDYSFMNKMLRYICPFFEQKGVFERFEEFYTWSRWNKLLFLSPVPDLDFFFESAEEGGYSLSHLLENIKHTEKKPFSNFYSKKNNPSRTFFLKRCFHYTLENWKQVCNLGMYWRDHSVIMHVLCGFLELIMFFLNILFPIVLCIAFYEVANSVMCVFNLQNCFSLFLLLTHSIFHLLFLS